jgi:hypothetical protein
MVGHIARMECRKRYIPLENLHGREKLEDLGVDERIILKWILQK